MFFQIVRKFVATTKTTIATVKSMKDVSNRGDIVFVIRSAQHVKPTWIAGEYAYRGIRLALYVQMTWIALHITD
jgi:hypothetical protein